MAPIPTPEVLCGTARARRSPPSQGRALGRLGEPSTRRRGVAAAGAAARMLQTPPLPPMPGRSLDDWHRTSTANASGSSRTASFRRRGHAQPPGCRGCAPAVDTGVHARRPAGTHVFVDVDEITGVVDWSEGASDALYDLASLTLRTRGAPWRRRRRLRHRRRPRRDPRVVVVASLAGRPLAGRDGFEPVLARLRGRRADIPA